MTTSRLPRRFRYLFYLIPAALAISAISVAVQVDDWGRDLTTNEAATAPDHADPSLRSIRTPLELADVARIVGEGALSLSRWRLEETVTADREIKLHFVRATRLFGFEDDIRVRLHVESAEGSVETVIDAESRSRVGRGDLGQNPRNLRELFHAVRAKL